MAGSLLKTLLMVFICVLGGPLSIANAQSFDKKLDLENFLYLDTEYGRSVIVLYPEKAPEHVKRIRKLVRDGFYDGLTFHRVIHGFMAQTGDPTGTGTGGSELPDLKAEFNNIPFNRGVIGAARTQNPNSANSQFFICFQAAYHLNGQYTAWGKVVHGMDYIDQIKRGRGPTGMVSEPDKIVKMYVAADVKESPPVNLKQFIPGFENAPRLKTLPRIE
jgi:peptidylprolyl isomerase